MPRRYARKSRRSTRRPHLRTKRTKKYTRGKRRTGTIRNRDPSQLIAPRFITTLRYSEWLSITLPNIADTSAGYQFNLNSIFDPDRTGTGHQPIGHDQLALLYNRYRVFGTSWRVTFSAPGGVASQAYFVFPVNSAKSPLSLGYGDLAEQPHSFSKVQKNFEPLVFTGHVSLPKLNGQTTAQYKAGGKYEALFGADPSELMTLAVAAVAPLATAQTLYVFVQLKYHVECFDPKELTQS